MYHWSILDLLKDTRTHVTRRSCNRIHGGQPLLCRQIRFEQSRRVLNGTGYCSCNRRAALAPTALCRNGWTLCTVSWPWSTCLSSRHAADLSDRHRRRRYRRCRPSISPRTRPPFSNRPRTLLASTPAFRTVLVLRRP